MDSSEYTIYEGTIALQMMQTVQLLFDREGYKNVLEELRKRGKQVDLA